MCLGRRSGDGEIAVRTPEEDDGASVDTNCAEYYASDANRVPRVLRGWPACPCQVDSAPRGICHGSKAGANKKGGEEAVVVQSNTRADDTAVVVEASHAIAAEGAVARADRSPDMARGTVPCVYALHVQWSGHGT